MGKNTAMSQEQALRIFQGCDQVKLNLQKEKSQLHPSKPTNQIKPMNRKWKCLRMPVILTLISHGTVHNLALLQNYDLLELHHQQTFEWGAKKPTPVSDREGKSEPGGISGVCQ